MTIPPWGLAIAAITVMLWIIWSDSIRLGRSHPAIYFMRVALYLATAATLIANVVRHPVTFSFGAKAAAVVAALVGLGGAIHFFRKAVQPIPTGRRAGDE